MNAFVFGERNRLETPEITVTLLERPQDAAKGVFSPEEQLLLYRDVTRLHNRFGYSNSYRRNDVSPLIERAIRSDMTTVELEYALYDGVLQAAHRRATIEELNLTEQAGQAFLDRFPNSWLRAQVCAVLARANLDKATYYVNMGSALPESNPLYKMLHVPEKLETAEWPTGLFPQNDAM